MNVREFFDRAIAVGRVNDPRDEGGVAAFLAKERRTYESLNGKQQADFDDERLTNPYADSRILNGPEDAEVKSMMVGVDLEGDELLLADRLRERGRRVDLCIAHHPEGYAQANLFRVMDVQADVLAKFGVPINVAEGIMDPRLREVQRRLLSQNHTRAVDVARLLNLPYMCLHTVADNCVNKHLQDIVDRARPETVRDVLDLLRAEPEYADVKRYGTGLMVLAKSAASEGDYGRIRAGQVFVDMTGGTGGSKFIFEKLATNTQVGTFVGMHISEENLELAKANHVNVVVAGHMASDSLGINLLLDRVLAGEQVDIIPCSGFSRVARA